MVDGFRDDSEKRANARESNHYNFVSQRTHVRTLSLDSLITERQSSQLRVRHGVFSHNHHFRYPLILVEKLGDVLLVNITDRLDAFLGQTGVTFPR